MRWNTARTAHLLIVLALFTAGAGAVAGCDNGDTDASASQRNARAREVSEAWDGSRAAEVWRAGYYPMGDWVQPPEGGFRNDADKQAYLVENYVLRGKLPADSDKDGQVKWESGDSLTLPLTGALKAYKAVDRSSDVGPPLTVTGAKLGEMTLATSRGPATVPAWLFTLEGYDTPLKRVAVSPSKLPRPPIEPADQASHMSGAGLTRLEGLFEVAEDGRSVTVLAGHGSCDDGPAVEVLETDGSVVLSASVVGTAHGLCDAMMHIKKVTVEVDRALGDRLLLDAFTGRPVPFGQSSGPSPSWS
jgi:hypothetical protein